MGGPGLLPPLLRAYRRTAYEAAGIEIRIGRRSAAMDRLLRTHGVRQAALITAWNPRSRRMPAGWNQRMQQSLQATLRRSIRYPANGRWRAWSEDHVLALIPEDQAKRLARHFRQNAIVMLSTRQPARLVVICRASDEV